MDLWDEIDDERYGPSLQNDALATNLISLTIALLIPPCLRTTSLSRTCLPSPSFCRRSAISMRTLWNISQRSIAGLSSFSMVRSTALVCHPLVIRFIKNPSGDEIEFYKFPHVAAEAFKCYPAKKVSKIAKSSLFDVIFDILNLPCPMENRYLLPIPTSFPRIAEYFAVMLSVFVEHAPKETYKYVSEHSETIIKGLYKHFNCVGMVDAFRFLLDLPIASMDT